MYYIKLVSFVHSPVLYFALGPFKKQIRTEQRDAAVFCQPFALSCLVPGSALSLWCGKGESRDCGAGYSMEGLSFQLLSLQFSMGILALS